MIRASLQGMAPWALTAAVLFLAPSARAQNIADTSYNAYNSAFLVQNGSSAFYTNSITDRTRAYMWGEASDIFVTEDYYARTHNPATPVLITNLLNTFMADNNGADWSWDSWNDDIAWAVIAFVRGYQITGNTAFLNAARNNWDMAYNRGWDSALGGGVWEEMNSKFSKCALSNDPLVISGCALYQITGDSSYLTKSQAMYNWVRTNLFNSTSSTNSLGAPGQVNEGLDTSHGLQPSDNVYNSGGFISAANYLYRLTGTAQYHSDAQLAITHIVNEGPVIDFVGSPGNPQYAYWFVKGVSEFATDNNVWSQYQSYMANNANTSWANRDSLNLTEDDWTHPNTGSNPVALNASSAVTVWQVQQQPNLNVSGNYAIVCAASNLALGVASNASYAAVVQQPYTGAAAQQWTFTPTGGGLFQIKNVSSGLVMNVSAGSVGSGATIVQYPAQGLSPGNDRWQPSLNSDGTYSFFNHNSLLALDDTAASTASGTQFSQYWPNNTNAQKFSLIPLGTIANGTYHLTPACATGSHLDVAAAGTTNGTNVDIYASNTTNAQKWTFTANAAGNGYRLSPLSSPGLSLDVAGTGVANGTNVDIWTSNTTNAQKWGLTAVSGGYTLTPLNATGARLDVLAGASADGTNVDIYQANGTNAQTWAITP
ncbi:RICIN domain-containing protein [Capsulimonas corticalis]|nr:RICIN domain-containing protein [Capsulimonas corticalis]